jgi:DNA-binding NarL/FixJ family response regulator
VFFPPLRALVVDDHPIIAAGLACLVEELGHQVVAIVGTHDEAVRSAEQHTPDLILMDVRLEGKVDGIQAALQIRGQLGIRSIFFSGYLDAITREKAALADPVALLDKTASKDDLARVIQAVAASRKAGEAYHPPQVDTDLP